MLILLKFQETQRKNLIYLISDDAFSTSTQIENVAFYVQHWRRCRHFYIQELEPECVDAPNYDGNGNVKTAVIVLMSKTTSLHVFCSLGPGSALGKRKKRSAWAKKIRRAKRAERYFSYFCFLVFPPPHCWAWSQAIFFVNFFFVPVELRTTWNGRILSLLENRNGKGINSTILAGTRTRLLHFTSNIKSLLLSIWATWHNRENVWKDAKSVF